MRTTGGSEAESEPGCFAMKSSEITNKKTWPLPPQQRYPYGLDPKGGMIAGGQVLERDNLIAVRQQPTFPVSWGNETLSAGPARWFWEDTDNFL